MGMIDLVRSFITGGFGLLTVVLDGTPERCVGMANTWGVTGVQDASQYT